MRRLTAWLGEVRELLVHVLSGAALSLTLTSLALAGLVGVDRQRAPLRDWAFEQLTANRAQFSEASQLFVDGKLEECHALLVKLRMANPSLPQADLVIVWLQLSNHKLSQAKSRLEQLAAAVPRDPQVALTLGQVSLAEGRLADAAAHLERTALLQLPDAWPMEQRSSFAHTTLETLAVTYERQSRWSDVKPLLVTLISMGDQEFQYNKRLARAHYNLGELDKVKGILQDISQRSAATLPVPLLMAELAFSSGKLEEAEAAIQDAATAFPDNAEVQMWLAEWSLMKNDLETTDRALGLAKKLGQASARYWISLGQCRMQQTNYADAISAFRMAKKSLESPQVTQHGAVAKNLLALALVCDQAAKQSDSVEAVALAEENALAYSTDPIYVGTLGWVYFKLGRREEAELLLQRALELNPRVASDLSFFVADFYSTVEVKKDVAQTFLNAALESSHGIFLMRPLALELQAKIQKAQ